LAIDCDGTGDFLSFAGVPLSGVPFSVACWFNPGNITVNFCLASLTDGTNTNQFLLSARGDVALDPVQAQASDAGGVNSANSSTSFSAAVWQHACGVWASATSRSAYLNGGGKGSNVTSRTPTGLNLTRLGMTGTGGGALVGSLAECAIWDIALSDDEVAILAEGYSPLLVRPQSLVACWPLIKNANVIDLIGGRTLTVNGNPTAARHPRVIYPKRRQPCNVDNTDVHASVEYLATAGAGGAGLQRWVYAVTFYGDDVSAEIAVQTQLQIQVDLANTSTVDQRWAAVVENVQARARELGLVISASNVQLG
jgi:hypothetical protein